MLIEVMIKEYQARVQAAEDEIRKEYDTKVNLAKAQCREILAVLAEELNPYLQLDLHENSVDFVFFPAELQLAPFYIRIRFNGEKTEYICLGHGHNSLVKMLAFARENYPDWRADQIKRQAIDFNVKIMQAETEKFAREIGDQWAQLDGQKEAAEKTVAYRIEMMRQIQELDEEAVQHELARQAEIERYTQAFKEYLVAQRLVDEQNEKLYQELQAKLDITFTVWELVYALIAMDEDALPYVETRSVFVANPEPKGFDTWGGFTRGGKIEYIRYFHLVSIQRRDVTPMNCEIAARYYRFGQWDVYAEPDGPIDWGALVESYKAKLLPNLERPMANIEVLNYWDVEHIQQAVNKQLDAS